MAQIWLDTSRRVLMVQVPGENWLLRPDADVDAVCTALRHSDREAAHRELEPLLLRCTSRYGAFPYDEECTGAHTSDRWGQELHSTGRQTGYRYADHWWVRYGGISIVTSVLVFFLGLFVWLGR